MNVRELRSLATLADLGSIAQTAEKLHVTPPAVHKRLKSLEETLGVQLYMKVGHRLKLTKVAEELLPLVKDFLAQRDAILTYVEEWKGLERGVIRIGAGSTFSSYLLPPLLEEFRRQFPDVEVFVDTGETPAMLDDVSSGMLDLVFAVSSEALEKSGHVVQARWEFDVVLVADPRRLPSELKATDLNEMQFILFKQEEGVFFDVVDQHFAQIGFQPKVAMVFDNLETTKAMTRAGLGASMLPKWTVEAELKDNSLTLIPTRELPLPLEVTLVTHSVGYLPQPVEAFIELTKNWTWENAQLLDQ